MSTTMADTLFAGNQQQQTRRTSDRCSDTEALEQRGYTIGTKIGKGSYATVLTSTYTDSHNRKVKLACKIVNQKKAPSDFLDKFFPRELDILAKIDHPYVIQTHSILQRGSKIFIFMRYAENGDLLDYIRENGVVREIQSKIWFSQMCKAIKYLHSLNISHRDLKCENILLTKRMNIKIADFGFARYCCDQFGNRVLSKTYCGSGAYAAPEVINGTPYNPKIADIWSLGVILFIMINGIMPFDDASLPKLLNEQRHKSYKYSKKVFDKISKNVITLIGHILEPDLMLRWSLERILGSDWFKNDEEIESGF